MQGMGVETIDLEAADVGRKAALEMFRLGVEGITTGKVVGLAGA